MNALIPSSRALPGERPQLRFSVLRPRPRRLQCCTATQEEPVDGEKDRPTPPAPAPAPAAPSSPPPPRKTSADSTDWIASSLTRRFGLGAGLAWVGFLAFGVVSEQIKTRREVSLEDQGTRDVEDAKEVVLGDNVKYTDLRVGGGTSPMNGNLILLDLVGRVVDGETFVDTGAATKNRPIALVFGRRPYVGGMCAGLEEAMRTMRVGGKRRVVVPADRGFGATGVDLGGDAVVPPNVTVEYTVTLIKASIAPS